MTRLEKVKAKITEKLKEIERWIQENKPHSLDENNLYKDGARSGKITEWYTVAAIAQAAGMPEPTFPKYHDKTPTS